MKIYHFNPDNPNIKSEIIENHPDLESFKLYINEKELYSLYPIKGMNDSTLQKVIFPIENYNTQLSEMRQKVILMFTAVVLILLGLSTFFAFFTTKPLNDAYELLEEFLKDLTHDLNTPVTAILLNLRLLKKKVQDDSIPRIEASTKTISSLYKNLETYINNGPLQTEKIKLYILFEDRIKYFQEIYPHVRFELIGKQYTTTLNREAFIRIIDNILSNACKYCSEKGPYIKVTFEKNKIYIEDNGIGIQNPSKIFYRHYKERDRGLGIGLNIVKKLCDDLGIKITLVSTLGKGTTFTLELP